MPESSDFSVAVIRQLRDEAGAACSICGMTTGYAKGNIGQAAHICGKTGTSARHDSEMTAEECRSYDNGIWLCSGCHHRADNNGPHRAFADYSVKELKELKENAIRQADERVGKILVSINKTHLATDRHVLEKMHDILVRPRLSPVAQRREYNENDPGRFGRAGSFIPFVGRTVELKALAAFLDQEDTFLWATLKASAGTGKSRLADEFIRAAIAEGWYAGRLESENDFENWSRYEPYGDDLIVIDYASTSHQKVRQMLTHLSNEAWSSGRVRVLLIERTAFEDRGWLEEVLRSDQQEVDERIKACWSADIQVSEMSDPDRRKLASEIYRIVAAGDQRFEFEAVSTFAYNPLFLAFAIESYRDNPDKVRQWSLQALLTSVVRRQIKAWKKHDIPDEAVDDVVYTSILSKPYKRNYDIELLPIQIEALGIENDYYFPLEPDIISELLFEQRWQHGLSIGSDTKKTRDITKEIFLYAMDHHNVQSSAFIARMYEDFPESNVPFEALAEVEDQSYLLQRLLDVSTSLDRCVTLINKVREHSVLLSHLCQSLSFANSLNDVKKVIAIADRFRISLSERFLTIALERIPNETDFLKEQIQRRNIQYSIYYVAKHVRKVQGFGSAEAELIFLTNQPNFIRTQKNLVSFTVTYNTLLDKANSFEEGLTVLSMMKNQKVPANTITYNTLLDKTNSFEEGLAALSMMNNQKVPANTITYNTLLARFDLQECLKFAESFEIIRTFQFLWSLLSQEGSMMIQLQIAQSMSDWGMNLEPSCMNVILRNAMSSEEKALVLKAMAQLGVSKDRVTYNTLIAKSESKEEALRHYGELLESPHDPDVYTINSLIKFHKSEEVDSILSRLSHFKLKATAVTLNSLIGIQETFEEALDATHRYSRILDTKPSLEGFKSLFEKSRSFIHRRDLLELAKEFSIEINHAYIFAWLCSLDSVAEFEFVVDVVKKHRLSIKALRFGKCIKNVDFGQGHKILCIVKDYGAKISSGHLSALLQKCETVPDCIESLKTLRASEFELSEENVDVIREFGADNDQIEQCRAIAGLPPLGDPILL